MQSVDRVLLAGAPLDAIDDLAAASCWHLVNVLPESSVRPAQRIFATADGATVVHFVEDRRLGVAYAAASGGSSAEALRLVAERLPSHPTEECHALLARPDDLDAFRLGLALLVLTQVEIDGASRGLLERALAHADLRVRSAVLNALTYAIGPVAKLLVARVAESDPELVVREGAKQILMSMDFP